MMIKKKAAGIMVLMCLMSGFAGKSQVSQGYYTLRRDQPRQTIWGLGVEIQSDAIGSGNKGLPDKIIAVPHDLLPAERKRFYKDMLRGFRYCRLAMGLYFRGLDSGNRQMVERYPNQLQDLKDMMHRSGMEGLSVEYWSPAPYWKSTGSFLGGTLRSFEPAFLDSFGTALAGDLQYLRGNGFKISMWGLQNEAPHTDLGEQSYSHCSYLPENYVKAFRAVAPIIKRQNPDTKIMVDSWDGNTGAIAALLRKDTAALPYIDAWVLHRIGANSNQVLEQQEDYRSHTFGKPVFQNEYEYFTPTNDTLTVNTAQSVLNWFCFANSPTWFWLHALKPTYNAEASGFSLGFWRPADDTDYFHASGIKPGHWDYNSRNFNALAGFLRYMPWNSVRYEVKEDSVRKDNRIMAYKTPKGKMVLVLTNRSGASYTFQVKDSQNRKWKGYQYTGTQRNSRLGSVSGTDLAFSVPDLAIQFWIEK